MIVNHKNIDCGSCGRKITTHTNRERGEGPNAMGNTEVLMLQRVTVKWVAVQELKLTLL